VYDDLADQWRRPAGIFVIVEVRGAPGERIRELQRRFDPKLANTNPPHITLVGSSGVGPIAGDTDVATVRRLIEPIAAATRPFALQFGPPVKFMQRDIVALPLDPHGAIRELHDRIVRSGLTFQNARFTFTPHATLNFFRALPREELRALLAERVTEPVVIDHLIFSRTDDPQPTQDLFEVALTG
jgi:2'-5' RNA ligase